MATTEKSPHNLLKISLIMAGIGCVAAAIALYKWIWPDTSYLHTQADLSTLRIQNAGKNATIKLTESEQAQLREWMKTLQGMTADLNTYAPTDLEIRGAHYHLRLSSTSTVLNFSPDNGTTWKQVSRPHRPEDRCIAEWLRSKFPTEPYPPTTPPAASPPLTDTPSPPSPADR
ncbi:MAG: hypothetical protein J1E42_06870 [Akkermansiaceae bacterium]|nr:hypothetical protein [Akkermansiaceae bacterium]